MVLQLINFEKIGIERTYLLLVLLKLLILLIRTFDAFGYATEQSI